MTKNKSPNNQELLCIEAEKVYDWIIEESIFKTSINNVNFDFGTGVSCDQIASVTCTITALEITEVPDSREDVQLIIDGEPITLQKILLKKVITYSPTLTLENGNTVTNAGFQFVAFEEVVLCAPEGTTINASETELNCIVTGYSFCQVIDGGTELSLNFSVKFLICQSITATFPVILELKAGFCTPREPLAIDCPTPFVPAQCPSLFPVDRHTSSH
ncbi:hypothetical protein [Bacillus sp. 2205SS5-2]|uniref:hypothetical protein n=1 Tax=Bacillus sp. 2205SS5-2 TaxID=3109031 RepID=UPI0030077BA9